MFDTYPIIYTDGKTTSEINAKYCGFHVRYLDTDKHGRQSVKTVRQGDGSIYYDRFGWARKAARKRGRFYEFGAGVTLLGWDRETGVTVRFAF